jgi:hypothetical protein
LLIAVVDADGRVAKEDLVMQKLGMSLFAGFLALGALACDDGVADTSQNAAKCAQICMAVDECTGEDNDRDCRMECVDKSENDRFEEQADECSECIEALNDCGENVRECATVCAPVVVLSAT